MATLVKSNVVHVREDLGDIISNISPEETPFKTAIGTSKASNTYHEFLQETLASANKDNSSVEGADASSATLTGPTRLGNYSQIFQKTIQVSGTLQAVNSAGSKNEYVRQIAKGGRELNRDIEAALISANPSVAGTGAVAGKLGGAEAWIKTNAFHGATGATAGFSGSTVGAVTNGTTRQMTEALFKTMLQSAWNAGGTPSKVITTGTLKDAMGAFNGNSTKYQQADSKTVVGAVDWYVSNWGKVQLIPHHFMTTNTVIAFDPDLWSLATVRAMTKNDLAKTGDSDKKQLLTEITLECLNEAGNGKLADVTP